MVQKFNRYFFFPMLGIGLVSLVGYVGFNPARTRLRAWRSTQVVADAETALQANNYMEAHRKVQLGLQLAPRSLPVHSVAARLYTTLGQPDALAHWQVVVSMPGAGLKDRYAYIDAAIRFLRQDLALEELALLAPTESRSVEYLRRMVRLQVSGGDFMTAVGLAREAQSLDPKDNELEFLLGVALLRSGNPEWTAEGRRLLLSIALSSGTRQPLAASTLLSYGSLTAVEGRQIARSLERRSDLSFSDRLMVSGFRLTADSETRETAVAAVAEDVAPSTDAERIEYVNWCLGVAAPRAARKFVESLQTTNSSLMALRLEAVARMEDWTAFDQTLQIDTKNLDPILMTGLKAWRQSRFGEADKSAETFRLAISMATELKGQVSAERLIWLASTADRASQPLVAIQAWEPLLLNRNMTAQAGRMILENSAKANRLEPAHRALRELLRYAPGDMAVQQTYAQSMLVLNRDLEEAAKVAFSLHKSAPDQVVWRILAAFAHFRKGQPAEGLDLLEMEGIDLETLDPRLQVMVALIRNAAGQRESARALARIIPPERLREEERALLVTIQ
jgi:predicted Zn-dependent protease